MSEKDENEDDEVERGALFFDESKRRGLPRNHSSFQSVVFMLVDFFPPAHRERESHNL